MSQDFSDFVRSLEPTGEPPDEAMDGLWTALRLRLRRTLQRRGLWDRSPAYLGVLGQAAWTTPVTANRRGFPGAEMDALDELTTDVYVELFVKRLPSLRRYAAGGDNLEKIVRLAVGQLIVERQRQNDRLGYRLYQWLRAALEGALRRRRLHVIAGGAKIRNDSVFGFEPRAASEPASEDTLAARVRVWNDELLLRWLTARGPEVRALVEVLEARILELRSAGVETFAFKSLVDALKRDVRGRLASFLGNAAHEAVSEDPLAAAEERQRLDALSACVEAGVSSGGGQQRTREKLLKLWRFLVAFAWSAADPGARRSPDAALAAALAADALPSHRQLSRLLAIRHDRIPALLARLKDEAERCLEPSPEPVAAPAGVAIPDTLGASAAARGAEVSVDETGDLRQRLKASTAEAFRRSVPGVDAGTGPEVGSLYRLEGCLEPGIEWLAVELDEAGGEVLAIPADSLPLLGAADVAVSGEAGTGPLSLRCDFGVWLPARAFAGEWRGATLEATDVDHARELHAAAADAAAAVSEIDLDPDYQDWRRSLEAACHAVARIYDGHLDVEVTATTAGAGNVVPIDREAYRRPSWRSVAAAASLVLTLGAGWWTYRSLQERMTELRSERDQLAARLDLELRPESTVPWLLAPPGTRRGSALPLVVPPGARSIALLIDAVAGDRLVIRDAAGDEIFSATLERVDVLNEALVRLPASRMPPGYYGVKLWRDGTVEIDFSMRIERP